MYLPTIEDVKFLPINFESNCNYLKVNLDKNICPAKHLTNFRHFCLKTVSIFSYYKKIKTVPNILTKEILLIPSNFQKHYRFERGIVTSLVTSLTGLVYEGISSYIHNQRQKALEKASIAMENQINLQRNKIFHSEDSMVMYSI